MPGLRRACALVSVFACVSSSQAVDPRFLALHNAFSAMGLAQVGPVQQGSLVEGREARLPIELQAQCTTLVAMGGAGVRDLDLVVQDDAGNALGHDATHDSQAVVRVCVGARRHVHDARAHGVGLGRFPRGDVGRAARAARRRPELVERRRARPGQGTCDSPIPITAGTYTGNTAHGESDNECTTDSPGCSSASDGQEIVYRLDVPSQKRLSIELDARYDAILYVRKDDCASQDAEVKCNDDDNNNAQRSRIDMVIEPGTYYVFVDSFNRNTGSYRMNVSLQDVPQLADVCRQSRTLTAGTTQTGTTHGAFDLAHASVLGQRAGARRAVQARRRPEDARARHDRVERLRAERLRAEDVHRRAQRDRLLRHGLGSRARRPSFVGMLDPGSYTVFADSSQDTADGQFTLQAELAPESGTGGTGDGCADAIPLTTSTTASGDTFDVKDDIAGKCTGAGRARRRLPHRSCSTARASARASRPKRARTITSAATCSSSRRRARDRATELALRRDARRDARRRARITSRWTARRASSFGKFDLEYSVQDVTRAGERVQEPRTTLVDGQTVSGNTKGAPNRFETSCGGDSRYGTSGDKVYKIVLTQRSSVLARRSRRRRGTASSRSAARASIRRAHRARTPPRSRATTTRRTPSTRASRRRSTRARTSSWSTATAAPRARTPSTYTATH